MALIFSLVPTYFFAVSTNTYWIINDNEAKELQLLGVTPNQQVQDWGIDHSSPVPTSTTNEPVYYLTGPNPVTQNLNNIEHNATQNESSVAVQSPRRESDQANFQNAGGQIEIELLNDDTSTEDGGVRELDIPKINLELDEECNWFEKTYNGSKLQKP